jgi:hypothetical protein
VYERDIQEPSLLVEINSDGDHVGAIESVQAALNGLYAVTYLGGYAPLPEAV